jgi:hypothetical protein
LKVESQVEPESAFWFNKPRSVIMTRGQGTPLPDFLKLDGEWIIENVAFLYHADHSGESPSATFPVGAEREDGSRALGFDSAQLAEAFGIELSALMEANRSHTLLFVGDMDVAPSHGGISAIAYIFQIGDRQIRLTTETYLQEGTG